MRWTPALIALVVFVPGLACSEEIVVTATRRPTSVEKLPARLDVLTREDIDARALASLAEGLGAEAVQSGGAGAATSLFLRGANSNHTLALFDGVRLNDPANPSAQYDFGLDTLGPIERVETLRGPASAVYGSDAIGGVVNLIPRRGGARAFAPFAEIAAGSFEARRALVGAAGSTGGLDYGLSYDVFDVAGHDQTPARMSTFADDADGARLETFTASARVSPSHVWGVDALLRWREGTSAYDSFAAGASGFQRGDDADLEANTEQTLWRLGADMKTGAWLWRASGGQVVSDSEETDGAVTSADTEGTRDFAEASVDYEPSAWGPFSASAITLGAGLAREKANIAATSFFDAIAKREDLSSAFVIAQSDVGAHWSVSASARVDDYEAFGAHGSYSLGAAARLGAVRVFGAYATAFKAPSLAQRFGAGFFTIANPDLEPEEARNWELGADWRVSEGVDLGASYFRNRIRHLIEYDFATLSNVNIGRAAIDGAEIFAQAHPTTNLALSARYAWTDARDDDTGAALLRRPEHSVRLEADWRPSARARVIASWRYVGERSDVTYDDDGFFVSSQGQVDAYGLLDIVATYSLGAGLEAFARVTNLGDEEYEQPAAFAGAPRAGLIGVRARL